MQEKMKKINSDKEMPAAFGFHLEVDRAGALLAVCIANVTAVTDFDSENALLMSNRKKIRIYGHELSVSFYENKTVEILGKIGGIEFL